jgi:glutathione S-transferase
MMTTPQFKILGRKTSTNVQKVTWLLTEADYPFEREDYGGPFGRNRDSDYLRVNPSGLVPTLIESDFTLWESNSICRYIATRLGRADLYPNAPRPRAECERWMDWQLGTLHPIMSQLYIGLVRTPPQKRDDIRLAELREKATELFAMLDAALEGHAYLGGDELTLADITIGPWIYRWFELGFTEERRTSLADWYRRLSGRLPYRSQVMIGLA